MDDKKMLNLEEMNEVTGGRGYQYGLYTIQAGDTVSSIAARLGVTVVLLKQMNNIEDERAVLKVGGQLVVAR